MFHAPSTLKLLVLLGSSFSLLLTRSASAGEYQIAANQPTVSGTVTVTCTDPTSMNYPGNSWDSSGLTFETTLQRATLHHDLTETWTIVWVPNEGQDATTDPPPTDGEGWEFDYDLTNALSASYPQTAWDAGSAQATVTINDQSYGLTAQGTPNTYDPESGAQTSFYEFQDPAMTGDPHVVVPFLVTGTSTDITIHAVMDGTASGDMNLSLSTNQARPAKASEAIHHTTPVENQVGGAGAIPSRVHDGDTITASGWWSGLTTRNYQVELSWSGPSSGEGPWYSTPFVSGSAAHHTWTSPYTFTVHIGIAANYASSAYLLYQVSPTKGERVKGIKSIVSLVVVQ